MILTNVPIDGLIAKLGHGDDFLRTDVVEELLRRAKRGEDITLALPALQNRVELDDVAGVRNLAREAIAEGEKSRRGENEIPTRLVALIERKDWGGLERLVQDHHIGYEVRLILEGKSEPRRISERLLRAIEVNRIALDSLPRVISGIVTTAQTRQTIPTGPTAATGCGPPRQLERR
jgi:hypothetical protein